MNEPTHKRCTKCGEVKPLAEFHRAAWGRYGHTSQCKACKRDYRQANLKAGREAVRRYREKNPEAVNERARQYREADPERAREIQRRHDRTIREKVLAHYSPSSPPCCSCPGCGTLEHLTIDHVVGGGSAHRREVLGRSNPGSRDFYRWLIRQGFPAGYQVLCQSCNSSKGRSQQCALDHYAAASSKSRIDRNQKDRQAGAGYQRKRDRHYYEIVRERNRHYHGIVLAHYSPFSPPRCACCAVTGKLTIDHISGGGKRHRKKVHSGAPFWHWLVAEGFPEGFQVLCMPCNQSKGRGDRCRLRH